MKRYLTLWLSIALFASQVHGAFGPAASTHELQENGSSSTSCSSIDMNSELGPIRDQKDLYWCYAFQAADLLTQHLQKNKRHIYWNGLERTTQQVSAIQMVAEFQNARPGYTLLSSQQKGGNAFETLNQFLQRSRICTEDQIRSEGSNSAFLTKMESRAGRLIQNQGLSTTEDSSEKEADIARLQIERDVVNKQIERMCTTPVHNLLKVSFTYDPVRRNASPGRVGQISNEQHRRDIHRSLESGSIIGVSYFANFLQNRQDNFEHSHHASSIVGRRMINGKCHLLLRNSWGPDCNKYVSPFREQCRSGVIAVEESLMLDQIYGTVSLVNQNSHDLEHRQIDSPTDIIRQSEVQQ